LEGVLKLNLFEEVLVDRVAAAVVLGCSRLFCCRCRCYCC
jgi:hypothetical protein